MKNRANYFCGKCDWTGTAKELLQGKPHPSTHVPCPQCGDEGSIGVNSESSIKGHKRLLSASEPAYKAGDHEYNGPFMDVFPCDIYEGDIIVPVFECVHYEAPTSPYSKMGGAIDEGHYFKMVPHQVWRRVVTGRAIQGQYQIVWSREWP